MRVAALLAAACLFTAPARAGEIASYERGTFAAIREEHGARPLVVHFWSTTCLPCLVEMPRLATFAREHPDVAMIFVAAEPIAGAARITARLERFALADAKTFAFSDPFEERLRFEVDRTWRGELPFTALTATDGTTTTIIGELETSQLTEWLNKDRAKHP